MKLNLRFSGRILAASFAMAFSIATAFAQPATWNGLATGGEWNTDASWSTGLTPGVGTNAMLGPGTNVSYNVPMTATGFGALTNQGILSINASGFNTAKIVMTNIGSRLFVNSGGTLAVSGDLALCSNATVSIAPGATVSANRLLIGSGADGGTGGTVISFGTITNFGGTLTANQTSLNPGNGSINTSARLMILGGVNSLGALNETRQEGGASASPVYGVDGVTISNGTVTATSITLGNNAHGLILQVGGTFTNTGAFTIRNATTTRPARYVQLGGFFSSANTFVSMTDFAANNNGDTVYAVLGGTNTVGGFQFGAVTNFVQLITNMDLTVTTNIFSGAQPAVIFFTNSATINIGAFGITTNGTSTINASLNTGGRFFSAADWTNAAPLIMAGGTFVAEDINGNPHNIYSSGALRGSGGVIKAGAGTMTLAAANIYSGNTVINAGTLALTNDGVNTFGSLANSASINVGSGATFDVSWVAAGFTLGSAKTMAGVGTVVGSFTAGSGSFISPAGSGAQGTLNFANGLGAAGATFNFELTDNPSGLLKVNDAVNVTGDLTASGVNSIAVVPVGSLGIGTYKLITYSGALNGTLANFTVPPTVGTLSNGVGEIDLIVTQVRPVATLVWRGDGLANVWDTGTSSNWMNGTTLDRFYTGDTNIFDDTATNSNLTVFESGVLLPASTANVVVKGTNTFTFQGDGSIGGSTGLIKTNSGTLVMLSTNAYSGVTTINGGGTIAVTTLANNNFNGPFGPVGTTANLVMDNGTLRYDGPSTTVDRGFTVGPNGGTINITAGATLTISNNVTGPGVLTKTGNGELSLTVLSDYAGGTVVQGGILRPTQGINATINSLGTNTVTLVGTNANPVTFWFGGNTETLLNTINVIGTNDILTAGNDTLSGLTGNGFLFLDGANTLTLRAPDITGFTGTLYANNLVFLRFLLSDGTAVNCSNTTFDLGTNVTTLDNKGGITAQIGALFGGVRTVLQGASSSGSASTYLIGGKNIDSTFSGVINEVPANGKVNLVKVGTGTFTLNGGTNTTSDPDTFQDVTVFTNAVQFTGTTVISNGVLAMVAPASLTNSPTVTLATPTAVLDVSQEGDPDVTGENLIFTGVFEAVAGHSINGLGTIRGSLAVDAGGRLNVSLPGTTGVLTVTNTVVLNGTTSMKLIKGNTPSSDNVTSTTAGSITYGGALVVTNGGGALAVNDTFTLFSAPTLSGSFTSTNLPFGYTWDTSQLGVNGSIKVTAVLAVLTPQFSNVNFSSVTSGLITFTGTGTAGGPVSLRASTDVTTPLASWTVVASGTFDGGGNYSTNLTVNPTAPKEFYILTSP